ncbi:MAG: biotin--[acetyl-CoA-carboxylase] ligase [Deltaproteobacteria bacterium]|nr:biotin--[acetyl-CoA-carboxylase] ligase [Deltaproteobacteria bacterium]
MPQRTSLGVARVLHDGAVHSGAEIARALGVSRAAVHKSVEALRRAGFTIRAAAGEGYALQAPPDRLVEEAVVPALPAGAFGTAGWEHHDVLDSTNTRAAALAREGAPHGTVVVAEEQTAGRGRRGRTFVSPPGTGVYLSVVLRPPLRPTQATRLTFCGALAVMDAARAHGVETRMKWPNDVFAGERKLAGILTELSADMDRIHQAIVGIGVNVNTPARAFPRDVRALATSVREAAGHAVDRPGVVAALLASLTAWYTMALTDFPGVLREVRARTLTLGRNVRVVDGTQVLEGVAEDLDDDGALWVGTEAGRVRVVAGDVELAGGAGGGSARARQ